MPRQLDAEVDVRPVSARQSELDSVITVKKRTWEQEASAREEDVVTAHTVLTLGHIYGRDSI